MKIKVTNEIEQMIGNRYGQLVVIRTASRSGDYKRSGPANLVCKCICGKFAVYAPKEVLNGYRNTCGCGVKKHINLNEDLYRVWCGMKRRCYNTRMNNYKNYGGRGIKVCDEWRNSEDGSKKFMEWGAANGYKKGLELDRIDNDGNYYPENCRWVTRRENGSHTRGTRMYTYKGVTSCLQDLVRRFDCKTSYDTSLDRAKKGWSIEDIIEIPARTSNQFIKARKC